MCDKWFIWIPSNCKCESDKLGDVGEYLDYENCKCRKKIVDKLVEECAETVEEAKIAENKNWNTRKCNSCILYIVLFSILLQLTLELALILFIHIGI